MMTPYSNEIKELFKDVLFDIYERVKPVLPDEPKCIKPLTPCQRKKVYALSTERGYRRIVAERMSNV